MNTERIHIVARNYNFLRIMENMSYMSSEYSFIKDNLDKCLSQNILSDHAAHDPFWMAHGILMLPLSEEDLIYTEVCILCPTLTWDKEDGKEKSRWNFGFKKALLPEGWSLRRALLQNDDCECGRNMHKRSSTFGVYDECSHLVHTLDYLEDSAISNPKSFLDIIPNIDEK